MLNMPQTRKEPEMSRSVCSTFPNRLQVEVTTRCNMCCAMCVKSAPGSHIPEADLSLEDFKKLGPALEYCEVLVLNGIGEPLLHPELHEMAAYARSKMPAHGWIGFQTNALLFTSERAEQLVKAGVDTFCISVDSLTPENIGGELHGQSSVGRLQRAFSLLHEASRKTGKPIRTGVEFVLMADTIKQLPEVVEWAAKQNAAFVIGSHVMAYDGSMQEQSLFNPNTLNATELFSKWQAKAVEQGLDLHDYHDVVWRFNKSENETILAALVKSMLAEAKERDIWLHLKNLLQWDRIDTSTADEAYAEAGHIAERTGTELRLPPLMAENNLHCKFIEERAAFITSLGHVSPCQFLWHQQTCYMDGQDKKIKPMLFGNIVEQDIDEIWNSADYAGFRNEVLEYAYPYCSNCPLVPCDDITGKSYDFEVDCLGAKVPCGHCPWSMGGVQCLM